MKYLKIHLAQDHHISVIPGDKKSVYVKVNKLSPQEIIK